MTIEHATNPTGAGRDSGQRLLLSGNAAIALGTWEAGAQFATGYPGTPSTDIMEHIMARGGISAEWASNEKVALDVAMGISLSGKRALVTMKHVGLNVAADSLMVIPYAGVIGGLVIVTADDPGMHSSQNEQDNRYFARFAKVPMLEPIDPQEAKDFVPIAFDLSERFETPVLLRTTTRISHTKGVVVAGERTESPPREYHTDIQRFLVPPFARRRRPTVEARLRELRGFSEEFEYNRVEEGDPGVGVIAGGVAYQYAREVLPDATFLRIGMVFPFPIDRAKQFCERFERVWIVEEGEPFIEEQLRIAGVTNIVGKEAVPLMGELNPEIVAQSVLGDPIPGGFDEEIPLPPRAPLFCLGCPHRGVFYVLQKMMKRNVVALGDIGCYTLGGLPPYSSMQTSFCMGASVGNAVGFALGNGEDGAKAVGVIGDGTFLHGGIPGLIDMVHRRVNATLVICDNSTTAMTGQQPNAASNAAAGGGVGPPVNLESLLASIGVEHVQVVDPYEIKTLRKVLRDAIRHPGPAVVVARHACLMLRGERKKKREPIGFEAEDCNRCALCYDLGCPAVEWSDDAGPVIDGTRCVGCGICVELCKPGALFTRGVHDE